MARHLPGRDPRRRLVLFEEYKVLEHKQVIVEDMLGPEVATAIIVEALDLYHRLRRGELVKVT